jgi:hypothetical protein
VEISVWKCGALIKISIIFEDFFREIAAFSRIARLFEYMEFRFFKVMRDFFQNVSVAFI